MDRRACFSTTRSRTFYNGTEKCLERVPEKTASSTIFLRLHGYVLCALYPLETNKGVPIDTPSFLFCQIFFLSLNVEARGGLLGEVLPVEVIDRCGLMGGGIGLGAGDSGGNVAVDVEAIGWEGIKQGACFSWMEWDDAAMARSK